MAIPDEVLNNLVANWTQTIKRVIEETNDSAEIYIRASCELYELILKVSPYFVDSNSKTLMYDLLAYYETIMDKAGVDYVAYKMEVPPHHTLCEPSKKAYTEGGVYTFDQDGDAFLDG